MKELILKARGRDQWGECLIDKGTIVDKMIKMGLAMANATNIEDLSVEDAQRIRKQLDVGDHHFMVSYSRLRVDLEVHIYKSLIALVEMVSDSKVLETLDTYIGSQYRLGEDVARRIEVKKSELQNAN